MDRSSLKQWSCIETYCNLNKFEIQNNEDFDCDNQEENNSLHDHIGGSKMELKLQRSPTFFPTSEEQYCENCDANEISNEGYESKNGQTKSESAIAFCQNCQISMCRRCCKCHAGMKTFRSHIVIPVLSNKENFIKKSMKTQKKRRRIEKYLKICKSAVEIQEANKGKFDQGSRTPQKTIIMNTNELEAYAIDCQESVKVHKEIDEKIDGLSQRINYLQAKLLSCDQVIEKFCQTLLSTQISIVEVGEHIRRNLESHIDDMLEKLKKEANKFCSILEDKKEEIVNSIDDLVSSRNALLQQKSLRKFDASERDKLAFLIENISNIQSRVMSKNREVNDKMEINFKPLDQSMCQPSVGRLEIYFYPSDSNPTYYKSANFSKLISFKNEVRGITTFRNQLALVTANCPTIYFLDSDTLELISTFDVKDMKNPFDLTTNKSNILFITEWSDKFIHRVELPVKHISKFSIKNPYTTLSMTPSGSVLATCPIKNKAREFDVKKSKNTVHFHKEKDGSYNPTRNGSSSGSSDETQSNQSNSKVTTGCVSNVCHTVAISIGQNENGNYQYLFCTSDSQLILADEKGNHVSSYRENFKNGELKPSPGNISLSLHKPSHLTVDEEGYIYVCDSGNDRVVVLDNKLTFVKELLQPGTSGIRNPLRIYLDQKRSKLLVSAISLYVFDLF